MYVTVGLYFITYLFKKTFGLKYYKPLIFPFAAIIFTLSLLPENLVQSNLLETETIREWGWIFALAMPILLLIIGRLIKRKTNKKQGKPAQ